MAHDHAAHMAMMNMSGHGAHAGMHHDHAAHMAMMNMSDQGAHAGMHHDHAAHMAMMNMSGHAGMHHDHAAHMAMMNMSGHGAHAGMDHASMDHSKHAAMGHSGMDHMMKMWFHTGCEEIILFKEWSINSVGGLIGSMIGIMIMAALYEGLKYYREYLFWKTYNALQYRSVTVPEQKDVVAEDNRVVGMVGEVIHKQPPTMLSWMHSFQTFLHIIQMVLSYFLMLIFMTYNVWLCFAVVLGAAIGYFLFGWKKSVIVDVTEHCH